MAKRGKKPKPAIKRKAESQRQLAEKRSPLAFRDKRGPFDIVGDVHGCFDELLTLLAAMNYRIEQADKNAIVTPPAGRTLAFVGDLVDRGPAAPAVLKLVMTMARAGTALCVTGNRDAELVRALRGRVSRVSRGMARSLEQLAGEPESFRAEALEFLHGLPGHLVLDEKREAVDAVQRFLS